MKKALVLTLLLVGVGAAAFAGPITGSAEVCAQFDKEGLQVFDTVIDLDYTISSFVFGLTAVFNLDAFDNFFFTGAGTLGTFELRTMVDFEPQTPTFMAWTTAGKITLGGASIFGVFSMENLGGYGEEADYGVGSTIGIFGTAGDVTVTATTQFNMPDYTLYYHFYGYDWAVARDAYQSCGVWYKPSTLPYLVLQTGCCLCWSGASIYADFPFTCLDVTAYASFACEGFGGIGFWFTGIETGIAWLSIDELDIDFTVDSKAVFLYWSVVLGDLVCVTPYFSLQGGYYSIDGITLNALLLEYSYNGVTVKAGELFDSQWYPGVVGYTGSRRYGFTLDGGLSYSCWYGPGVLVEEVLEPVYDEFFGIWVDGDSCCGGAYDISVINFFDTSATEELFAWQETVATLQVGIGTNVSVKFSMSLMTDGLQWFKLCGLFNF